MDSKRLQRTEQDATLVELCLQGDSDAWEALIHRYGRLIYSVPLRLGLSAEEAADVFQGVCLVLLRHLDKVREIPRLASWIVTTSYRESSRVVRQRPREVSVEGQRSAWSLPLDTTLPDRERIRLEEQALVRRGVDELPARCRRLLRALYFERPKPAYEEISRRFQLPKGAIGPTRARCLEKLRDILRRMGMR